MNYNSKLWKDTSKRYKALNPVCKLCKDEGRITPVSHVGHIKPVENGGDPYDEDNLISLCKTHYHSKKHKEKENHQTEVIIVCGPPGSGKTTYVREHINQGELVFDFDALYQALSFQPEHVKPEPIADLIFKLRDKVYEWIRLPNKVNRAYIITTMSDKKKRHELVRLFNAELLMISETADTCKHRIREQGRKDAEMWYQLVDDWFDTTEQST